MHTLHSPVTPHRPAPEWRPLVLVHACEYCAVGRVYWYTHVASVRCLSEPDSPILPIHARRPLWHDAAREAFAEMKMTTFTDRHVRGLSTVKLCLLLEHLYGTMLTMLGEVGKLFHHTLLFTASTVDMVAAMLAASAAGADDATAQAIAEAEAAEAEARAEAAGAAAGVGDALGLYCQFFTIAVYNLSRIRTMRTSWPLRDVFSHPINQLHMIPAVEAMLRGGLPTSDAFFEEAMMVTVSRLLTALSTATSDELGKPPFMLCLTSFAATLLKIALPFQGKDTVTRLSLPSIPEPSPATTAEAKLSFILMMAKARFGFKHKHTPSSSRPAGRPAGFTCTIDHGASTDTFHHANDRSDIRELLQRGKQQRIAGVLPGNAYLHEVEFAFRGVYLPGCSSMGCANLDGHSEMSMCNAVCGGCRRARYCSVDCQKHAWLHPSLGGDGHGLVCAEWARQLNSTTPAKIVSVAQAREVLLGRINSEGSRHARNLYDSLCGPDFDSLG